MIDDLTDQSKKKRLAWLAWLTWLADSQDLVDPAILLNATYDIFKVTLSNFQLISRTI